jgi:aldose sugar dehydrogenase
LSADKTLIDNIPAAQFHAGCRVKFGPDKLLYVTTGDATDKNLAQDLNSLAGKILRVDTDGKIPTDNPFGQSLVYSYGHRNPQGIAWNKSKNIMYSTEHGPSLFDGPAGGDEVNIITPGGNYGWPIVSHDKAKDGLISPLILFTPAEAPASAMVYDGEAFNLFKGDLFFSALVGEGIIRVKFDPQDPQRVLSYSKLDIGDLGRIRETTQGPDGYIYFTTSNRDGRGQIQDGDDKIYRIKPK